MMRPLEVALILGACDELISTQINLLSLKCAEWDGALLLLEEKMS